MSKSYVERDILALRKKLIEKVKEETSSWTDFNESDLGMVFIEVLAGCVDMLNYYLDKQANEVFLDRAEEPKNIRSILNTMNYRVPFKMAAEGIVRFINPEGLITNDVVIPRYTELSSSLGDIKQFVTKEERVLVGGEELVEVPVIQGSKKEAQESVSRLKKSWKYYLNTESLADKSVRVIDSEGEWVEVDDAFLEYEGGRFFSVHRDAKDKIYILFTWNWKECLPLDNNELVTIQYIETLGNEGRSAEFTVDTLISKVYDVEGIDVTKSFIVNNPEAITGGTAEPDIYKMIVDAKNNIKMMGRLVTLEDYTNAAAAYNGIFKSVTQDWSVPNNFVNQPYQVNTWVISYDGEPFSESYLETMARSLSRRGIAIVKYNVIQAVLVKFNVKAQIKIKSDNVEFRSSVRRDVIQNLNDRFGYGKMEFGERISWDDIRDVIKHTNKAITSVEVLTPTEDTVIQDIEYPVLDNVDIEVVGDFYGL